MGLSSRCSRVAAFVCAALTSARLGAAAPVQDLLVQPPSLASPSRGSIAGSLSKVSFGPAELSRGAMSLPLPLDLPSARGPLLAAVAPSYSPESGLSEWGMGWQAELAIKRYRVIGELDYATDDFTSPWGKLRRGDDGKYYPTGLTALVALELVGDAWTARMGDGTVYRFELADRVLTPQGTYAWMLSRVENLFGDGTTLVWTRNSSGRAFLDKVRWGGRGDGTQYELTLTYGAVPTPLATYISGARFLLDKRVSRITVAVKQGQTYAPRATYDLTYTASTRTPAYFLASLRKTYASGATDPDVTYDYDIGAEHLTAARFAHVPALDWVIAANGNRVIQPDRTAQLDLERDGATDLESYYDFSVFHQTAAGFVAEPLPAEPTSSLLCRPPPSVFNKPRTLARMDGAQGEPHVVVTRKLGFGGQTQLLVCDRKGAPLADQTVTNTWELGPLTRLVDVDRDRRPDIVRVSAGRVAVLRNVAAPPQLVAWSAGPETLLSPQVSPQAAWLHDLNGDGAAELIIRHPLGIGVWNGLGGGRFEATGRAAAFRLPNGSPLAGLVDYELSFGDYNGDGLADVIVSKGQSIGVFFNTGAAFVQTMIPAFAPLPWTASYPVIADLTGSGEETVMMTDGARAMALALTAPGTGLLRSANDGKGTTLRFSYQRAPASSGLGRRPSVLAAMTIESSGYDAVTQSYAYGGPVVHSVGQHFVGFSSVEKRSPVLREQVTLHNDDDISGLATATERRDERTPGLVKRESSIFEERAFHGVRWLRPSQRSAGMRSEDGTRELAVTTMFLTYEREHCATVVADDGAGMSRVETILLAEVPALDSELHCMPASKTVSGLHEDSALDFDHRVDIERDALGQPTKLTQVGPGVPSLVLQEISYDAAHRVSAVTVPGRGTTQVTYDSFGRPRSVTDPLGVVTEAGAFDPVTETLSDVRTNRPNAELELSFRFDGKERLMASWDDVSGGSASQPLTQLSYQEATALAPGRIDTTELVDVASGRTRKEVAILAADGEALAAGPWLGTHAALGPATFALRASAATRTVHLGNLTATELGALTSAELRSRGQVLGESLQSGFGGPVSVMATLQAGISGTTTTEVVLTATELVTRVHSPGGFVAESATDARGNVMRQTDETGVSHTYGYDALGRLVRIETPDGVHRVDLDAHGRPARVDREGLGSTFFSYDPVTGLLAGKQVRDADGALVRSVAATYDSRGRIVASTEQAGAAQREVALEYDGVVDQVPQLLGQLGNLSSVTGPGWRHTTERDALGRPKSETWTLAGWRKVRVESTFFANGEVRSATRTIEDAAGAVLSTTTREVKLDAFGRPAGVEVDGQTLYTATYDDEARLSRVDFANGESIAFEHDAVTHQRRGYSVAAPAASGGMRWDFDARGLVTREIFSVGSQETQRDYTYDGRRQLVSAAVGAATAIYTYSPSGMPQTISDVRGVRAVRRTGRTLWVGDVLYTWDAAGRVVGKGEWSYSYGASGQLETAQRAGRTITYVYDDAGRRLLKRVDGMPVRAEVAGGILTEGHFVELVVVGGVVAGVLDNGVFTALLTDSRGTPFAGPDGTPGLATPFGVRAAHLGQAEVIDYARLGWDPDLDSVRMGVRDYDATLGQFWTPDPLYLESLETCAQSPIDCNLYGYAKGNPLSWVDPSGTNPTRATGVQMIQACDECGSLSQSASIESRYTSVGLENGMFKVGYQGQDGQRYVHSVPMNRLSGSGAGGLVQLPGNVIAPRLWNDASARDISNAMSTIATVYGNQANGAISAMEGFNLVLSYMGAYQTAQSLFRSIAGAGSSRPSASPAPSRPSVWSMRPFDRGVAIEKALGQNLPENFPVIDRFAGGVATSIKSLDLGAKSYQRVATLTRTVNKYINDVARFKGREWAGAVVRESQITGRALELAVPASGGTAAQQAALQAAVRYGQTVGVQVKVIPF